MRITSGPGQVIETFPEEYSRTGREDENLQLLIRVFESVSRASSFFFPIRCVCVCLPGRHEN